MHPHLGKYAAALIDPNRPESASLAMLATCLLGIGWAWFALLATVLKRGEPLALDRNVYEAMFALRNPLADRLMAALASIGDGAVLVPAAALALLWLVWRRRWIAAAHWLAALAFGFALTTILGAVVACRGRPTRPRRLRFPSVTGDHGDDHIRFLRGADRARIAGQAAGWPYL